MFWVYVLKSQTTGKTHTGYTKNLDLRLKRHNQELPTKVRSFTRLNKGPWKVVYKENFETKKAAMNREKQLKSAKGRQFIKREVLKRT